MREKQRDILLLSLASLGSCLINLWPAFYPYFASYCYHQNHDITMEKIYGAFMFVVLGMPFGNLISPYVISILGITSTLLFMAFLNIFILYGFMFFQTMILIYLQYLIVGVQYQITNTAINMFLSLKYENGISNIKYISTSRLVYTFIMVYICQFLVNFENEQPNVISQEGQKYFSQYTSSKFYRFALFHCFFSFMYYMIAGRLLNNPQGIENQLLLYLKALLQGRTYVFNIDKDTVEQSQYLSNQSISLVNSINRSQSILFKDNDKSLDNKNEKSELLLAQNPTKKLDSFIITMLIILTLNSSIAYYCLDNFKYVGMVIGYSDRITSFVYSLTCAFYILSSFFLAYIWENFSFIICIFFYLFTQTISIVLILLSKYKPYLYLLSVFPTRFNYSYHLMMIDLICFGLYPPMQGLLYAKYLSATNLFGCIIEISMNYTIFTESNYLKIFYFFFLFNAINIIVTIISFSKIKIPKKYIIDNQFKFKQLT